MPAKSRSARMAYAPSAGRVILSLGQKQRGFWLLARRLLAASELAVPQAIER